VKLKYGQGDTPGGRPDPIIEDEYFSRRLGVSIAAIDTRIQAFKNENDPQATFVLISYFWHLAYIMPQDF
jgi:hypothetical protein